jgi:hypothetical protein
MLISINKLLANQLPQAFVLIEQRLFFPFLNKLGVINETA